jgi:hypothetical protein
LNRSVAGLPTHNIGLDDNSDDEFLLDYTQKLEQQVLNFSDEEPDVLPEIPQLDGMPESERQKKKSKSRYCEVATVSQSPNAKQPMVSIEEVHDLPLKEVHVLIEKVPSDDVEIVPNSPPPPQRRFNLRPRRAKTDPLPEDLQPKTKRRKTKSDDFIDPEIDYPQYVGSVSKLYDEQNNCMPRPGPSTSEDERYAILMSQLENATLEDVLEPKTMFKATPNSESLKEQGLRVTPKSESKTELMLRTDRNAAAKRNLSGCFDNVEYTIDLTETDMEVDDGSNEKASKISPVNVLSDEESEIKLRVDTDDEVMEIEEKDPLESSDLFNTLNENVVNMNDCK